MKNNQLRYSWKMPTILGGIVFILWGGSFYIIKYFSPLLGNRGLVGDSFGAINALFSGLAFAGLIYTIFLQMKELELTRDELRKSSEAQQRSEEALAEQVLQMEKAATLNALSSIINYHTAAASGHTAWRDGQSFNAELQKAKEYIQQIKSIAEIE